MAHKYGTRPKPAKPAKGVNRRPNVNLQTSCGADYSAGYMKMTKDSAQANTPYKSTRRT